jgi:tartrate dehydratase beta subunit/fumarate hydratase class I family protein
MARIIKVQCTGRDRHVNEIDLDDVLGSDVVLYGGPIVTGRDIPARIVRRCDVCDEGKVIITREMIEGSV